MEQSWNFHNNIGIYLESESKVLLEIDCERGKKMFDADYIESGKALEVMIILLRKRTSYDFIEQIDEFIETYSKNFNKRGSEIEKEEAYNMLEDFKKIYN